MTYLMEPVSAEIFRTFFENSVIGMSMTSLDGTLLINRAFCDMLGYSQEEMSGIKWMDITYPDDVELNRQKLALIMAGEQPSARWQKRYIHKNQSIVWADISTALQRDADGKPQYFITTVTDITESKKLRDTLAESELNLRESQNIAHLGTYAFDLLSGMWCSSEILDGIFGITRDYNRSFQGWADIIHPEWQQEMVDYVSFEVVGKRQPFNKEYKIVRISDQVERWLHGRGKLEFDADGNPFRLFGTIMDITDRKLVELGIREDKRRAQKQRNAIASLAVEEAVAFLDVPSAMRQITEMLSTVVGVERASIWLLSENRDKLTCQDFYGAAAGEHVNGQVLLASDYPVYFKTLAREGVINANDARNDPRTIEFKENYLRPFGIISMLDVGIMLDGAIAGVVCLEHTGNPREWKPDEEAFVSTIASITAQVIANDKRKKSEEALRESEERYRLLMRTLPDSVIVHSMGRIVYANPASARIAGAAVPEDLLGMEVIQFVHPDYREMAIQRILKAAAGVIVPLAEEKLIRLDGGIIDVEVTAVPMQYFGQPAMLTVINDITDRKRGELLLQEKTELIQAQNEEYLQINEELTQANEALTEAKARAEESDRLKSAFLANMSHEIRTPLNSIIGFSELLFEEQNSMDQVVRYSSIIRTSGARLLQLISNLIDISKIESGTEPVLLSQVSPALTVHEVIGQFRLVAEGKNIEIVSRIDSVMEHEVMVTDSLKLHQILTNLVGNAMKFNSNGLVEVGLSRHPEGFLFFVRDNGIGIPAQKLTKVFDRFYQVDSSFSRRNEGAGLGLSLCKGMVELLGGSIWVESEEGKGSRFSFTLPAK